MSTVNNGPQIVRSGLVLDLDSFATSRRKMTQLGCGLYNGSTDGVVDLVSGTNYPFTNKIYNKNKTYYTAFAIDYPEGSYGGDAANRQGITPGLNVRSGTKTYDAGRALHLWAWDENGAAWVADSFFGGAYLSGHCYDNYSGAGITSAQLALFASNYNTIKSSYPKVTFIVMGSHRADTYNSTVRDILTDLGKPTGFLESDFIADPEWVLVGQPGLGQGNAFGWAYENYTTNPTKVAHLNFGLPRIKGGPMVFDSASSSYINFASNINSGQTAGTWEFWLKSYSLTTNGIVQQIYIQESSVWLAMYNVGSGAFFGCDLHNGTNWFDGSGGTNTGAKTTSTLAINTWYHVVYAWSGSTVKVYLNGSLESTTSTLQAANGRQNVTTLGTGTTPRGLGYRGSGSSHWNGEMGGIRMYNRELSASEVSANYQSAKTQYI